jgi:Flp pilus assembly pilin Flp
LRKFSRLARLPASRRRRAIGRLTLKAMRSEAGGEVLEYAIVAGLIVIGAVGVITCVGVKVLVRWRSVNSSV